MPAQKVLLARPYEYTMPFLLHGILEERMTETLAPPCADTDILLARPYEYDCRLNNILGERMTETLAPPCAGTDILLARPYEYECLFNNILGERMETHRKALFAGVAPHQLHVHSPERLGREARSPPGKPYEAALIFSAHRFDHLHVQDSMDTKSTSSTVGTTSANFTTKSALSHRIH